MKKVEQEDHKRYFENEVSKGKGRLTAKVLEKDVVLRRSSRQKNKEY